MSLLRALWVAAAAVGVMGWGTTAFAQSVALNESSIQRSESNRPTAQNPNWISREDCLVNDQISFPLTVSDYGNYQLEAWVGFSGDDCTVLEARKQTTASCWKVYQGVPTQSGVTVILSVRDIVSEDIHEDGGLAEGTEDSCEPSDATTAPQAIDVYFMFIDPGAGEFAGGVKWSTKFDLAGPIPPDNVSAGVGETLLTLEWDQSTDTDQAGYRFYCDPIPGKEDEQTNITPLAGDASADADFDASMDAGTEAGDAALDADLDAAPDGDPDGATDADTGADGEAGTDSGSPSAGSCPTTALIPGQEPDEDHYCGSGTGTSGRIKELKNGVQYSVAVAAVDGVGNVGKLSNVACNSPSPTDDFYTVYRDAGGKAGGGFCTASGGVGHGAGISGFLLVAFAAVGGAMRRRRHS